VNKNSNIYTMFEYTTFPDLSYTKKFFLLLAISIRIDSIEILSVLCR
jgi:hypothetical protein